MLFYSFVVHKAITVSRMFPSAAFNRALFVELFSSHRYIITYREVFVYQAIGKRIQMVEDMK